MARNWSTHAHSPVVVRISTDWINSSDIKKNTRAMLRNVLGVSGRQGRFLHEEVAKLKARLKIIDSGESLYRLAVGMGMLINSAVEKKAY